MAEALGTSTEVSNESVDQAAYEQEMIAKAEGAEAKSMEKDKDQFDGGVEDEPLLAGKYKTPEDLEKAYKELEAKLGANKEETPNNDNENKDSGSEPKNEDVKSQDEAKELVESKGIDFKELNQEFANEGELSKETYKRLEDAGIGKEAVDAYIAGQQALAEQNITRLHNSVGGEESFNSMVEWATDNLSEAEKASFNTMVSDEASAEFAIKGLYARYKAEAEPNLLDGTPNNISNRGYQSTREMMVDMANPKYRNDPAFRKMVEQKVARSKF